MRLVEAISRMLTVYGAPSAERAAIYAEAVAEEHLCSDCAAEAARQLSRSAKRRPTPADLIEQTRDVMATGVHAQHVRHRAQLTAGPPEGWWRTQAPAIVRSVWPELSDEAVEVVCCELQRMAADGLIEADAQELRVELGWVDVYGPTPERMRWVRALKAKGVA